MYINPRSVTYVKKRRNTKMKSISDCPYLSIIFSKENKNSATLFLTWDNTSGFNISNLYNIFGKVGSL